MSLLFKVENKRVVPHVETLLLYPFNEIWERDNTEDKTEAIEDFTYIEFMGSVKKTNPFSGYHSDIKASKIQEAIITREDWSPDTLIVIGIAVLEKMQREASVTYNYYISAKIAAEKMQNFFETFDINTVNTKTLNPLYKPKDITSALLDTSRVLQNLKELEEKVDNEIYESAKIKGKKEVSPLSRRDSL